MDLVVDIGVRIAIFLVVVGGGLYLVVRRMRSMGGGPVDREVESHVEAGRRGVTPQPPWYWGRPIHERAKPPREH